MLFFVSSESPSSSACFSSVLISISPPVLLAFVVISSFNSVSVLPSLFGETLDSPNLDWNFAATESRKLANLPLYAFFVDDLNFEFVNNVFRRFVSSTLTTSPSISMDIFLIRVFPVAESTSVSTLKPFFFSFLIWLSETEENLHAALIRLH